MDQSFERFGAAGHPSALWVERPCPPRPTSPDTFVAWSFFLAPSLDAPGRARRALAPLAAHLDAEMMETARLLVSELMTNSVLYAGDVTASIELQAQLLPESVVISVSDQGAGFDPQVLRYAHPGEFDGRGLELVARLADERGIDSRRPFRLWFALSR